MQAGAEDPGRENGRRMRRLMCLGVALVALTQSAARGGKIAQWDVFETSYETKATYANPFTDLEVNVVFRQGDKQWLVPAFWAGGRKWTVRFAPPMEGEYRYHVECTDKANADLNGGERTLRVSAYQGSNNLLKHGFLRVSADKRHFEHADGTPFFWLGDTWWKGLANRLTWDGFQALTADRKAKGFSLIQIVIGPYPDEAGFEPRWDNEGGKPYETPDFSKINPAYFDYADRRIHHLVQAAMVPAIVGGWGFHMKTVGGPGFKRHWRNLVARFGAYPVVWIVAGEAGDTTNWSQGPWTEVAQYLKAIDPYRHPLACHPNARAESGRRALRDDTVSDFDIVGGNHDGWKAVDTKSFSVFTSAYSRTPSVPVLCGETAYEGHMQNNFQDLQRHIFWMYMLSGAAGHTYGAAGVWHGSVEGDPGITPVYDLTTWREGMNYPGSTQLGRAKKLLERYPWWRFEPHPEWVEAGSYAAGIPGEVRIIYLPRRNAYNWAGPTVKKLEADVDWHAYYVDPATGRQYDLGTIKGQKKSGERDSATIEFKKDLPSPQDWVLVLERLKPGRGY